MNNNIRDVFGYEGIYTVDDNGNVFSSKTKKIHSVFTTSKGYQQISLRKNGELKTLKLHRLILLSFQYRDDYKLLEVNHIDGNPSNNKLNNLEWCTRSYNIKHAIKIGLIKNKGEKNHNHKLVEGDINYIRTSILNNKQLGKMFNVSNSNISLIRLYKTWK